VPLVYEVSNPAQALRIGMTLTLYVETATVEDAIAIPQSALVDEEGRYVAFVQAAGETFVKRDLVLGLRDTGFVQVVQGLSEGERVTTEGAYAIRLASVSTTLPAHGHSH
jgi:membrane fusion protein, heavy metal efflux system